MNKITQLFAIKYPIIQGGMIWNSGYKLASAVSNAGGLGLISVYFLSDKVGLLLAMVGVGIAWASILSIPYAMLSGSLPSSKMGYYMGVFNFFIVIPQIVAGTILGFLVNTFFNNEPIYALIIGGFSMILAGLLTLIVSTNKKIDI